MDIERKSDSLSRIVSTLDRMERELSAAHAEVDAFNAPSECHELVERGFGARVLDAIKAAGYPTVAALEAAIEARTSARWIYFHGPSNALGQAAEAEEHSSRRAR